MAVIRFIFACLVGIIVLLGCLFFGIINFWIIFFPWHRRYRIADKTFITPYSNFVNRFLLFIKLTVIGDEYVDKNRPTLYICNHQSWMDIQIFVRYSHATAIAKNEVLTIPFVNFLCLLAGALFFDAKSKNAKVTIVKKAMVLFRNNYSLCLFPEGTRSKDGRLLKPNLSIIRLCYKENIAVVPAAIEGSRNVMARGSVIYNFFQQVVLKYTPPVLPENFSDEDSFAKACWQSVIEAHTEISSM